jgi:hypothetical protein
MTSRALSGRVMAGIWIGAVAIVAGCIAALQFVSEPTDNLDPPPFAVLIGSSLTRFAFPYTYPADRVFPAATATDRLIQMTTTRGMGSVTERLRRAVDVGVKHIYIEIDSLLTTHRNRITYLDAVRRFSLRLHRRALLLLNPKLRVDQDRTRGETPDGTYRGDTREVALFYPATVHPPRNSAALAAVLADARRKGIHVVWMSPPRSETLASYVGPAYEEAFEAQLKDFAKKFGAEIWRPVKSWPDELFVDHAHLNHAGRARFFAEFRRYVATAR